MRQKNEIPNSFQTDIMRRFMGEDEVKAFNENYQVAKQKVSKEPWTPNEGDLALYSRWIAGEKAHLLAKEQSVTRGTLDNHFATISGMIARGEIEV